MNGILEIKDFVGSVKDVDMKKNRITGYLSSFDGKLDSYRDIASEGMFKKTLMERGPQSNNNQIFFLNQHMWSQPHGKFAELEEDKFGLSFVSEKLIDTSYSTDVMKLYDAGILKEHSFGYETMKSEYDKENDIRTLIEVKLYEGSNVTLGADSNTPFTGFKNKSIVEIQGQSNRIIKMLKNGTVTDDTFILLEIALKQLQLEAFNLGKEKTLDEPDTSTQTEPFIESIKKFNEQFNAQK